MWRQLDRYLSARLLLPWLPVLILWQTGKPNLFKPELLGALAVVLAARSLTDGALTGLRQVGLGFAPLLGGALLLAGVTAVNPWAFGLVYYLAGGLGTTLTAIADLRGRR